MMITHLWTLLSSFLWMRLTSAFKKASAIMMQVHEQGKGIAGAYSKEIALMKVKKCNQIARHEGHPLLVTMEAE